MCVCDHDKSLSKNDSERFWDHWYSYVGPMVKSAASWFKGLTELNDFLERSERFVPHAQSIISLLHALSVVGETTIKESDLMVLSGALECINHKLRRERKKPAPPIRRGRLMKLSPTRENAERAGLYGHGPQWARTAKMSSMSTTPSSLMS